jgi:hypothetical protein
VDQDLKKRGHRDQCGEGRAMCERAHFLSVSA